MLTITMPNIAVQKVTNGFIVQWEKRNDDKGQANRTKTVSAVCLDAQALLSVIKMAAADIADLAEFGTRAVTNMKPIAATPDLLEALQRVANLLGDIYGDIADGTSGLRDKYLMAISFERENLIAAIHKATLSAPD